LELANAATENPLSSPYSLLKWMASMIASSCLCLFSAKSLVADYRTTVACLAYLEQPNL
jgi:hypothetical protein